MIHLGTAKRFEIEQIPETEVVPVDIVFDGPPGHKAGRFVEVETVDGKSLGVGEWIDRGHGFWALRIPNVIVVKK